MKLPAAYCGLAAPLSGISATLRKAAGYQAKFSEAKANRTYKGSPKMDEGKIFFEFKNLLSELDKLRQNLESLGKSFGMSKKGIFQINLALEEVFTNIVSHGFEDKDAHWIKITIWHQNGMLNICVEDDGIPFNPVEEDVPDLKCPVEDRRIGGLGCHFMRCLMDDVHYKRIADKNVLTMKKGIEGEKTS